MNRIITKKPASDQKLNFAPMGQKPGITKVATKTVSKKKTTKANPFAKKAAMALVKGE